MAVLVQLDAADVDAGTGAAPVTLFVRGRSLPSLSSSSSSSAAATPPTLQLEVVDGDKLYHGDVAEAHKPRALDCSPREYVRTLEAALCGPSADTAFTPTPLFAYKWSRTRCELTLMEQSPNASIAMKYTTIALTRSTSPASDWYTLLLDIVAVSNRSAVDTAQQRQRITELEALVRDKDVVLDAALAAKQQLEDALFDRFAAVLNAKKDAIARLQHAVTVAQMQLQAAEERASHSATTRSSTKPSTQRRPRDNVVKGTTLLRAIASDNDESSNHSVSDDDSDEDANIKAEALDETDENDDDDAEDAIQIDSTQRERLDARRQAVDAYSQLPSATLSLASQVCTADDVLADLGAILQQEVAAADSAMGTKNEDDDDDDAAQSKKSTTKAKTAKRPPVVTRTAASKRTRVAAVNEEDATTAQRQKPATTAQATRVASPPRAVAKNYEPIDSDEEDILDMLA